ncbi:MAG TPA: hypothetical protein VMF13_03395 [Luteitalea sp.]|nr:hypothetical protein [Luteitalea sp.]
MTRLSHRERLIAQIEARHIVPAFPRGQLTAMLGAAGLFGFLTSATLLSTGVDQMWLRYPAAVAGAYLSFLVLLRVWIAWQRGEVSLEADLPWQTSSSGTGAPSAPSLAAGGRSGGAGGGATWQDAPGFVRVRGNASPPSSGSGGGWSFDLDLDDGVWLVVAAVCLLGGVIAVGYVVYIAPVLLAEVALDAAVVGTVYKRLQPHDIQHWSVGVVRRTWAAALILALCLSGAGAALAVVAPDARSIGGVVAHLLT